MSQPSNTAAGLLLAVIGVVLIAQTLVGGLVDRILGTSSSSSGAAGAAPVTGAGSGPGGSGSLAAPAAPVNHGPGGTSGDLKTTTGPLGPMGSKPL